MSITGNGFRGLSLWLSLVGLGAQPPDAGLKIEVHIYNYSAVSHEMLVRAEQETAKIYRGVGVEMEWLNCARSAEVAQNTTCELPGTTTRFTLRLLSNALAQRLHRQSNVYGLALLPENGGLGVDAYVFADRARDLAADEESRSVILGHLIAHELGHLLLGETGHPALSGIMHVPWQAKELERIKQGQMCFFPEQAKRIRAQVLARAGSAHELF
jgi:hypothetical protein